MAYRYSDGTWCARNADRGPMEHKSDLDNCAGNGRFGYRIRPLDRADKNKQKFSRAPKRRKGRVRGNLCHTTPSRTDDGVGSTQGRPSRMEYQPGTLPKRKARRSRKGKGFTMRKARATK